MKIVVGFSVVCGDEVFVDSLCFMDYLMEVGDLVIMFIMD